MILNDPSPQSWVEIAGRGVLLECLVTFLHFLSLIWHGKFSPQKKEFILLECSKIMLLDLLDYTIFTFKVSGPVNWIVVAVSRRLLNEIQISSNHSKYLTYNRVFILTWQESSLIKFNPHCKYMHWKYSRRALFCVIFEKITRIYLLSQVYEKSAIKTHFKCNLIAVCLCKFYTRRNVISKLE